MAAVGWELIGEVLDGQRDEPRRLALVGPEGLLLACREAILAGAPARLDEIEKGGILDWLDWERRGRHSPGPGLRGAALLAAARAACWSGPDDSALLELLAAVAAGFADVAPGPWRPPPTALPRAAARQQTVGPAALAVIEAMAAAAPHPALTIAADLVAWCAGAERPGAALGQERQARVAFLTSFRDSGDLAQLGLRLRNGHGLTLDALAAPFTRVDAAFAEALATAWAGFGDARAGVRWSSYSSRSDRPHELITGPSVGLAAAVALRTLLAGHELFAPPRWAFTGAITQDGRLGALLEPGGDLAGYRNKLRAASGRTVVAPAADVAELASAAAAAGVTLHGAADLREVAALTRAGAGLFALPPALEGDESFPLSGRGDELARLSALWADAAAGRAQAALLSGEAGSGKSRLVRELGRAARDRGAIVLHGRCDELVPVPYQPFAEALRALLARSEEAGPLLAPWRADLAPLLGAETGAAAPAGPAEDSSAAEGRLFDAVAGALAAVGDAAPVLLIVEDLHWATAQTVRLLRALLRTRALTRFLLVGTFRVSEGDSAGLRRVLAEPHQFAAPVARIDLAGLDADAVADIVAASLPSDARPRTIAEIAEIVQRETGGNALFVSEIVRDLAGQYARAPAGAVGHPAARLLERLRSGAPLPSTVMEIALGRIEAHLSPQCVELLRAASVLGEGFDYLVLREVAADALGLDDDALLDRLAEAVEGHVVDDVSGRAADYRFAHALLRTALYEALPAPARSRWHRRAADAIERLVADGDPDKAARLAVHYGRCATIPGYADKAAAWALRAGAEASERLAYAEAARWYRQAADALEGRPERAHDRLEALVACGRASQRGGDAGARDTLYHAALEAIAQGDRALLTEAALAANRGWFARTAEVDGKWVEVLEQALSSLPEGPSPERAELLSVLASELVWAPDAARRFALADEALAGARASGSAHSLARVLYVRHQTISCAASADEQQANSAELCEVAEALGEDLHLFYALANRALVAASRGRLGEGQEAIAAAAEIGLRVRQAVPRWTAEVAQASFLLAVGRLEEAEEASRAAYERGDRAGHKLDAWLFWGEQTWWIRRSQGRLHEVAEHIESVLAFPGADAMLGYIPSRCLFEAGGEHATRATRNYEAAVALGLEHVRPNLTELTALTNLAFLAVRLGDLAVSAQLVERLAPYAHLFPITTVVRPCAAHSLGMLCGRLGRLEEAVGWYEQALALHRAAPAPLFAAETVLEWARTLSVLDPPQSKRALALAAEAREAAAAHRASGLAAEADSALARIRNAAGSLSTN
ncbi:MAG: ATP-binding protein [Acidimicrobiales bacterium]